MPVKKKLASYLVGETVWKTDPIPTKKNKSKYMDEYGD